MLGLFILFNRSHQIINMLMAYQLIDPLKIEDHHDIVFMAVERFFGYFQFLQNIFRCHLIRNTAQNLMLLAREGLHPLQAQSSNCH